MTIQIYCYNMLCKICRTFRGALPQVFSLRHWVFATSHLAKTVLVSEMGHVWQHKAPSDSTGQSMGHTKLPQGRSRRGELCSSGYPLVLPLSIPPSGTRGCFREGKRALDITVLSDSTREIQTLWLHGDVPGTDLFLCQLRD